MRRNKNLDSKFSRCESLGVWLLQAQLHEVALYIVSTKGVALPYGWPADFM